MTSTRLPGKVLLTADGHSMLAHQLHRLSSLNLITVVATTTNATDDPIAQAAADLRVECFRGSESDVLGRFAGAAEASSLDVVVRVTADCPLIDPSVIGRGIRRYLSVDDVHAYVSNVLDRTYPRGFDFEVFSTQSLREAAEGATTPAEREHVTPYIYTNRSGHTTLHSVRREHDASAYRITLDTSEDLTLIRRLITEHRAHELSAEQIIRVLDAHPELVQINAHVEQKKLGQ
ncbi:spore coat polysaccharide biosynthesis protein SpsF [Microbacterium sp. AK031]|nr:spore coat polysaccharide biosynthesis protein SpsF [Microbacterium sp. AK031]